VTHQRIHHPKQCKQYLTA